MRQSFASGLVLPQGFSAVQDNLRVERKGILGYMAAFVNNSNYLAEFIGAFTTYVERQSTFHRHKYLQAIADLEILDGI